jgi:hypothetical protein
MSVATENSNPTPTKPGIVLFLGMVRRGEFENLEKRGLPLGILVDTNSKARLSAPNWTCTLPTRTQSMTRGATFRCIIATTFVSRAQPITQLFMAAFSHVAGSRVFHFETK